MTTAGINRHGEREPLAIVGIQREHHAPWLDELLRKAGFTIRRADSARQAHAMVRDSTPDLILIGAHLSGASGLEVCRTLRDEPWLSPTTPIVLVLPNQATRIERLGALRGGAWECIDAASDREELLIRLEMWLVLRRKVEESASEGLLDPQTRLYNRQGLARRAREMASEASRRRGGLACVVFAIGIDLHTEPTREDVQGVVRQCADVLRTHVRVSDALGHLVLGEFAVIAPVVNGGAVDALIERLARDLQEGLTSTVAALPPVYLRVAHTLASNVRYTPIDPVRFLGQASAAVARAAPRWWHPGATH